AAAGRKGGGPARAAILGAARRLYVAHGASGVSARKIARELGCSPTAIYLYYRSIPDIIEHLRLEGHALLAARLRRVDPKLPALERVRAMGRAYASRWSIAATTRSCSPCAPPRRHAARRCSARWRHSSSCATWS